MKRPRLCKCPGIGDALRGKPHERGAWACIHYHELKRQAGKGPGTSFDCDTRAQGADPTPLSSPAGSAP